MRRHIAIYLGEQNTSTHCGECQILRGGGGCMPFGDSLDFKDGGRLRLPDCIAAEVKSC